MLDNQANVNQTQDISTNQDDSSYAPIYDNKVYIPSEMMDAHN